jgi:hypothetical protein
VELLTKSSSSSACLITAIVGVELVARYPGLLNGTSAPANFAIAAVLSSSVDTITRSTYLDSSAAIIDQAIRGLPHIEAVFFPGKRLLPARAGIIAKSCPPLITINVIDIYLGLFILFHKTNV